MNVIFYPDKNSGSRLPEASQTNGYWVRLNEGASLEIFDISSETHIKFIIQNPELFNLTTQKIEDTYKEFDEPMNLEGKAREALMVYAINLGWIRIRHYTGRSDYWSFQCDDSEQRKKAMQTFVYWAIKRELMTSQDDVMITGLKYDNDYQRFNFQTGGVKAYLPKRRKMADIYGDTVTDD